MRILFFGDSITQGFWAKNGGWVEIIRKYYDGKAIADLKHNDEHEIFNLGVSGDTTRNLVSRVENEIKARVWEGNPVMTVIAIGTNDDVFESDEQRVSPDEFKANLQKIIDFAKPHSKHIILLGNTACDEALTTPVFWGNFSYTNKELARSEQDIAEIAKKNNLLYIPMYEAFKEALDNGQDLLADGLHPNDRGHQFMANIILPQIKDLLAS